MLEEEKINQYKRELIAYATLVEGMIDKSIRGLLSKDRPLLIEAIEQDEPEANDFELRLDEKCTAFIAQHQPKAKALRTMLMSFKMTNDLERMADHAVNIAEVSLVLIEPPSVYLGEIPKMAEVTKSMLKDSIDAYVHENPALAEKVLERDNTVDDFKASITKELITLACSNCGSVEPAIQLLVVVRNLERIADLSTNICENVIFMVEGRVVKHGGFE